MRPEERLERYARLAVEVGSNIGPGQDVWVSALPEHAPLVRAIARCGVRERRALRRRGLRGPARPPRADRTRREDMLGWTPPLGAREDSTTSRAGHGAQVHIVGDPEPELLADLDGARVGKTRMRELAARYVTATHPAAAQLDDRRLTRTRAGRRLSSASPTSSGSGTPLPRRRASTRPTPSRRGGNTSRSSS